MTEQIKCCRTCKHRVVKLFFFDRCNMYRDSVTGDPKSCKLTVSQRCMNDVSGNLVLWEPKDGN